MDLGDLFLLGRILREAAYAAAIPPSVSPRLAPAEISVLDFLFHRTGASSIGQIAARTSIAQSRVSTVVQGLLKRKWVEVVSNENDRRSTLVRMKPEVDSATRKALSRDAMEAVSRVLPSATESELKKIERGLSTLTAVLNRQRANQEAT